MDPEQPRTEFAEKAILIIKSIPKGRICTYGGVAAMAGNPAGARTVAWLLHSSSAKEHLPWHRIINSRGTISLKPGYGYELQRQLLESEGVDFDLNNHIDFERFLWHL